MSKPAWVTRVPCIALSGVPKVQGIRVKDKEADTFLTSATAPLAASCNKGVEEGQGVARSLLGGSHTFDQHPVTLWARPIMGRVVGSTAFWPETQAPRGLKFWLLLTSILGERSR